MKTIIAGSRYITDYDKVCRAVEASGFVITEVVSGCARGVDTLGEQYANKHKLPIKQFMAAWKMYGIHAGPFRNQQMADYAEALIAIPGPDSRGTWDMVQRAMAKGLRVYVYEGRSEQ